MRSTTGFQSATFALQLDGMTVPGYAALYALLLNFIVSIVLLIMILLTHRLASVDEP